MNSEILTKLFEISDDELQKINSYTRREFKKEELYTFSVILCDNEIDRDDERFSVSALKELEKLFLGKTGIFDHSMRGKDQVARLYYTEVQKIDGKKTKANETYHQLYAKGYMVKTDENKNLIDEIDAGIKKEVSVSCSMADSKCSICGANVRKERCEHIFGKIYGKKICHKILSNATDAYEFSFVAVPCQPKAGVTKSFTFKNERVNKLEDILKTLKSIDSEITITKSDSQNICGYIEKLENLADVGKEYQLDLQGEVMKMCAVAMPEIDLKVFKGVVDVMTISELKEFKKAFSQKESKLVPIKTQFAVNETDNKNNYNEFKI